MAALVFSEAYMVTLVIIDGWLRSHGGVWPSLGGTLGLYATFFAPIMVIAGFGLDARERLQSENLEILTQAQEAQARALLGQLNPHVLFNALNGLAELVHRNSPAAEDSIRHLSALLRKVLNATEQPAYTLDDERDLLEDYLHMEQLRLGDRLRLSWNWDQRLAPLPIAPLLLQPLVENAIKHSISPCEEGGCLEIEARNEGAILVMEVRSTGTALDPSRPPGVGIRNTQARMKLLYGRAATFSLTSQGGWTVASLRLRHSALDFENEIPPDPRRG